jgi:hypothetical protein
LKIRILIALAVIHAVVGFVGFLLVNAWALAIADAGGSGVPTLARGVGWVVDYVLLQPLAHWVIDSTSPAWWTWPGLALLVTVIGLNSAAVAGAIQWLCLRLRSVLPTR